MALQTVELHDELADIPVGIGVGTTRAWRNNYAFMYNLVELSGFKLHVCNQVTETGLPGEKLFIVGHGGFWYACEGTMRNGEQSIRQACFRTREDYWERGWHSWEVNSDRHTGPFPRYSDGWWMAGTWNGDLLCETR